MRCIACGAELPLGQSGLDHTTLVPSDDQFGFLCSGCGRPLLVEADSALPPAEPVPVGSAVPVSLRPAVDAMSAPSTPTLIPSESDEGRDECEVLLERAIEMVRGRTRGSLPAKSLTDGASALGEADSDRDECDVLLKRAIEMVRGRARGSHSVADGEAACELDGCVPVHSAPPTSTPDLAEADLAECGVPPQTSN
jgi:hypothetical protein